jgi:hypothetical protein
MIRFIFRLVGMLILAGGFIAFIYDGTKSIAGGAMAFTPLEQFWNNVHATSLQSLREAITLRAPDWLWDPVALSVLQTPAWVVFGILGALLMLIGRKKRPLIGYARE